MLICTEEWRHPEESNMFGKRKSTIARWSGNKWCTISISFPTSHIQETKTHHWQHQNHDASTSGPEETCSFYWYNMLMRKCSKRCQLHVMFAKNNALNSILCFWTKFKCGQCSNSAIQFGIKHSEFIKKHSSKCSILRLCKASPWECALSTNQFLGDLQYPRGGKKSILN